MSSVFNRVASLEEEEPMTQELALELQNSVGIHREDGDYDTVAASNIEAATGDQMENELTDDVRSRVSKRLNICD